MSDETKTIQPILDVDAQKVAMAVGHVAALALVTQMREGVQSKLELYYRLFEPLEEGRQTEDDLSILAQYVCDRPENVTGEQLFRKAAELALHKADPDSYFEQPHDVREAYRLFANPADWFSSIWKFGSGKRRTSRQMRHRNASQSPKMTRLSRPMTNRWIKILYGMRHSRPSPVCLKLRGRSRQSSRKQRKLPQIPCLMMKCRSSPSANGQWHIRASRNAAAHGLASKPRKEGALCLHQAFNKFGMRLCLPSGK